MKRLLWPGSRRPARRVAGVVLLKTDGSALLQLRDNKPGLQAAGLWVFPGGHCHADETTEQGAHREFAEETGYRCARLTWITGFCHPSDDLQAVYELSIFASVYDGWQAVDCYEGQKVEFVRRDSAASLPMPNYVIGIWDLAIERLRHEPGAGS